MRYQAVFAALALFFGSAPTKARNVSVAIDVGYSRIDNRTNGYGGSLFVGYEFANGIVPELQLGGFRHSSTEMGVDFVQHTIPIMLGARYYLDLGVPVRPFAGAHVGLVHDRRSATGTGDSAHDSGTHPGFNVGLGVGYQFNDTITLGLDGWYFHVFANGAWHPPGVIFVRQPTDDAGLFVVGGTAIVSF